MTSSMLSGDQKVDLFEFQIKRGSMTVLGKVAVAKPINLPSQRRCQSSFSLVRYNRWIPKAFRWSPCIKGHCFDEGTQFNLPTSRR
ncbi:hypothetical protein K1719_034263 [Acacia pycnantha]|nr:hypothetical protein K1719_034263 [Acacia pycnantha]